MKQYMVEGCPCLPWANNVDTWNYVKKLFNQQAQTAQSEESSENAEPPLQHRLVHLPKTTKFLGAQIEAGQTICNECFVHHTIKCDAEAAAEAAL